MPKPFKACLFTYKSRRVIIWPLVKVFEWLLLLLLPASCSSISCEARANSPTMDGKTQCTYSGSRCAVAGNVRPSAVRPNLRRPRRNKCGRGRAVATTTTPQQQHSKSADGCVCSALQGGPTVALAWGFHKRCTWPTTITTSIGGPRGLWDWLLSNAAAQLKQVACSVALQLVFPFWMKVNVGCCTTITTTSLWTKFRKSRNGGLTGFQCGLPPALSYKKIKIANVPYKSLCSFRHYYYYFQARRCYEVAVGVVLERLIYT